jgi:phosphotransferase system enzyme I (PtsP)
MAPRLDHDESSLLLTLEEISQLVSGSHNPQETLANVVRLLQRRFATEVCSVYLLEPRSRELVLAETVGLKPEAVGRVRMRLDEGLTGLTAQQAKPVVERDAFAHPRFKYFPDAGEDRYHAFLGVPLLDSGEVTGVLVLQTAQAREFTQDEVRMLLTAASQLSPLVGEAWVLKQVEGSRDPGEAAEVTPYARRLAGTPLSPGAGAGSAYWASRFEWDLLQAKATDPAHERRRLDEALALARRETERLSERIATLVGDAEGGILEAQLLILQDRTVEEDLTELLGGGASAEAAVLRAVQKYSRAFEQIADNYFRERLYDIKDVFRRILRHLRPFPVGRRRATGRLVLVGEEASVADLFNMDADRLAGIVVEQGGRTSHAAILARSLGIPMVSQVGDLMEAVRRDDTLLVDGDQGLVYVQPTQDLLRRWLPPQGSWSAPRSPAAVADPARPPDAEEPGRPAIEANINLLSEVVPALEQGARGVGLYRTEFLILYRRSLVGEEQQVRHYRQLLRMLAGRPVNIRTFDLRAEKAPVPLTGRPDAGRLDWRLVLRSPSVQRVFHEQVRAILRAAVEGPARILVPLVVSSEQLAWVKATVAAARQELRDEGLPQGADVPLGIMIEVPVAATMTEEWAPEVDFLCVGTNDLLAAAMGVGRDDPVSEIVCDPLHPGLLRTLSTVVSAARAAGKPVTVCGEMAATPQGIRVLSGLGVDVLSVAVSQIPAARAALAAYRPRAGAPAR